MIAMSSIMVDSLHPFLDYMNEVTMEEFSNVVEQLRHSP